MKKVAGTLKLDQAQYRELEAFAKFGSDLDAATMSVLEKGKRNVEILKQGQFQPVTVGNQIAMIYLGTQGLLRDVPVDKIREFEGQYLSQMESHHPQVLKDLAAGKYNDELTGVLAKVAKDMTIQYKKTA